MKCIHCGSVLVEGKYRCANPKCRMWNVASVSTGSMDDSTVLLSDASLQIVERVMTGVADKCFGGGMSKTSVNLLGGDPGAGKTTLSLQISDIFAGIYQKEVLYIANEQHAPEIKETAERLHLKNMRKIRIVKAMGGVTHDIGSMLLHFEPCLTILDSVTKWSGEDMREAVVICQRLKDYTVRLNAPTIVVNQVTKSGDHSGLNQMQHAVDSTMLFEILGENPQDPRRLMTRKNRNGPAPISQYYDMTPLGLFEITEEEAMIRLEGRMKAELPPEDKNKEIDEGEEEESEE
jgi:DNA repair protein RadA/Sms